jgi:outer membrane receptor protein involved in Fe transport
MLASALVLSQQAAAQAPANPPPANNEIIEIFVWGRGIELLGAADSGSHGIVGNADFSTRPLMRVGELVEVVPGMIATQHSGPGKANQYFLRGMNLDHGSDFTAIFDGMPVNFRSHAHASGYLDINFMIPEIIETVEFHKGTYYAKNGDYSAAGSARFQTYDRLDDNYVEATLGSFNNRRVVAAGSVDMRDGSLLLAGELMTHDGPWDLPADQQKTNVYAKYTGALLGSDYARVSFAGYDSDWNSTDQIPLREVQNGNLGIFGFIDPTLGGASSRYSLMSTLIYGNTEVNGYYSDYKMNLFGNPTYFLNDPVNGDQIEQQDDRAVWGGYVHHSQELFWGPRTVTPTIGLDVRYDDIDSVALFNTRERVRLNTVRDDIVEEMSYSLFGEAEVLWSDTFRTTFGVRGEFYDWDVTAHQPLNSGSGHDSIVLPKFAAAWIPADGLELYFNYGHGFHSNDVRGAELTADPVTGDPVEPVDVMVLAKGSEVGARYEPFDGLNLTLVHFWMELDSELLFVGDAGTSEPNEGTKRRGLEFTAFWEMTDYLVFDFNATKNHARFKDLPRGFNHVPDAHETTVSAGLTYVHPNGFTGSLRMRHFGDAPLDEADSVQKDSTTLFNLGLSWTTERLEVGLDVLNLLDSDGDDIEFWFESQLASESAPVADFHFHPVESRAYRALVKYKF